LSLSSNSINSINTELIEAIAAELAVDASLVEKDWYAIQIIAAISKVKHSTMQLVFSGGTSLSKGYGLIQRFSEDIDFKVANAQNHKRDDFRNYRAFIIESIRQSGKNWSLSDFVLGMSYAKDSERPNFHQSLAVLERLVTLF
jgi:predicted nucleotidyltransferase component of viral defense system